MTTITNTGVTTTDITTTDVTATGDIHAVDIQHTNGTSAMTIDSTGRVLLPQLVAFMGKKTDTSTYGTLNTNITFNATKLAHAAWNGTTFTAPITGVYRIFVNGHSQSASGTTFELGIFHNGSQYETSYGLSVSGTARSRVSVESIMQLTLNDTITFRLLQGDTYAGGSSNTSSLMCSGHLLG